MNYLDKSLKEIHEALKTSKVTSNELISEVTVSIEYDNKATKKYNGNAQNWWMRAPYSEDNYEFRIVYSATYPSGTDIPTRSNGIAPAFRIG